MKIIKNAIKENRVKMSKDAENYVYYEKHHVLPKSLFPAWEKRKSNVVLLTAREHFFCHQLLTKIYHDQKMFCALWRLTNDGRHKCTSREYERNRLRFIKNNDFSVGMKGKTPWNKGLKNAQVPWNKGKHTGNGWLGRKHSDEAKKKISEARKGKSSWNKGIPCTAEQKLAISLKNKGRKQSKEACLKKALANQGKVWWTNGIDDKFAIDCPVDYWKGRTKVKGWKQKENK